MPRFHDRASAGRLLATELLRLKLSSPVVYALPRGGVPVAKPVAEALQAPLDLLLVRKIGVPWHPELAAGSIVDGERPDTIYNEEIIRQARLTESDLDPIAARELKEIERRRALYLPNKKPVSAKGRTAILVDDGIATGASMRAAIAAVRRRAPARIVVAIPVAALQTVDELRDVVDDVICLSAPEHFQAVGLHYEDFHQLTDQEVIGLLADEPAAENAAPGAIGRA